MANGNRTDRAKTLVPNEGELGGQCSRLGLMLRQVSLGMQPHVVSPWQSRY